MNDVELSIIVVSFNTRELTLECLRSLYAQTCGITFEVLVVDNASRDGSADAIVVEFPQVELIQLEENIGFARANNLAMERGSAPYLLLLNPDTIVLDNTVRCITEFARQSPRAAVVGCRTLNRDGSLQRNCFRPPTLLTLTITAFGFHRLAPRSRLFGCERFTYWDYDDARVVPIVAGCFMLVRREAIAEVGGLDESFFMYGEEVDWCVRFERAGWEVWYTPIGTITHLGGMSAAIAPFEMRLRAQKSLLIFLRKYHGVMYVAVCRVILLIGLVVRLPLWLGRSVSERGLGRAWLEVRTIARIAATYIVPER